VHEAADLQRDLRRAGIEPFAWVINQSLAPLELRDPVLVSRQAQESRYIAEVCNEHASASRTALLSWQRDVLGRGLPTGADRLVTSAA
jgi:arsenite/tail-anchored protein-transporting ATPase